MAQPHRGTGECSGTVIVGTNDIFTGGLGLSARPVLMKNYLNPFLDQTTFQFKVNRDTRATLRIYDLRGNFVATAYADNMVEGDFTHTWYAGDLPSGAYVANLYDFNGNLIQSAKPLKTR